VDSTTQELSNYLTNPCKNLQIPSFPCYFQATAGCEPPAVETRSFSDRAQSRQKGGLREVSQRACPPAAPRTSPPLPARAPAFPARAPAFPARAPAPPRAPRCREPGGRRAVAESLWTGCCGAARAGGIVAESPAPGQGRESAMAAAVAAASGVGAAAR
jgi:hypothetical protein